MAHTANVTLSSLYSSGQCLLSVLGSIGVILLFAGIPQLIYAPQVNPGSLMTFLLGALLISFMVAGNAFIGYKYRQLVRERREETRTRNNNSVSSIEDKPPSYDDLLKEDGLPPAYASIISGKPPRYEDLVGGHEDLVAEVFNWQTIANVQESYYLPDTSSGSPVTISFPSEMPIIVPIQKHIAENLVENQTDLSARPLLRRVSENLQNSAQKTKPVSRRQSCGSPSSSSSQPTLPFSLPRPSIQYACETGAAASGSSLVVPRFSFSNIPTVHDRLSRQSSKETQIDTGASPKGEDPSSNNEESDTVCSRL